MPFLQHVHVLSSTVVLVYYFADCYEIDVSMILCRIELQTLDLAIAKTQCFVTGCTTLDFANTQKRAFC